MVPDKLDQLHLQNSANEIDFFNLKVQQMTWISILAQMLWILVKLFMHSRYADWLLLNFNIYCHRDTIDSGFSLVNIFFWKSTLDFSASMPLFKKLLLPQMPFSQVPQIYYSLSKMQAKWPLQLLPLKTSIKSCH